MNKINNRIQQNDNDKFTVWGLAGGEWRAACLADDYQAAMAELLPRVERYQQMRITQGGYTLYKTARIKGA